MENLEINGLDCKSSVANEFFDFMMSQDLSDDGLKKFGLFRMRE